MNIILHAVFLLGAVRALDISIDKVVCDESLDMTADIHMECDGGSRCPLGSTTNIYGTLYYNGVYYSGIQNNQAYLSVGLQFLTLDFKPLEMKQIQLCSENLVSGDENQSECPGDGSYSYSVQYKLPSAGDDKALWLASGFQGDGVLQMFAEEDERMLIGECQVTLKTFVTRTEENMYGPFETPSAAASIGMVSALSALIGLCCCYSYCCIRCKKRNTEEIIMEKEAGFVRMEDEKPVAIQAESIAGTQTIPDSDNQSTIMDIESPGKKNSFQMPLI